jgi:hypothetical protein
MPSAFDHDAAFQPLPPAALTAMRIGAVLGAVLLVLAAAGPLWVIAVFRGELSTATWLLLVLGYATLLLAAAWGFAGARWRRTGWRLDDDGLAIRRGVFWRSETLVPRSRVQHVDLSHGPLDRHLGLAALTLHTAGTRLAAVSLGGLEQATAEALRDVLVDDGDDGSDHAPAIPVAGADHGG